MVRESASNEERNTARMEMVVQGLYVFGGHHTMLTLVKLQTCELTGEYASVDARPTMWWDWPAMVVGLPDAFAKYVHFLDVCSEFDNEPIALAPSWHDRVAKLRNRWGADFKDLEGFKKQKDEGKATEWMKNIQLALGMKGSRGNINQLVQMVAVPNYLWQRYSKLITGDFVTPNLDKKGQKIKGKKVSSASQIFQMFSLRPERQAHLLDSIIKGEITLEKGISTCKVMGQRIRCRQAIERRFQELGAIDPTTGKPPKIAFLYANTPAEKLLEDTYQSNFTNRNNIKDAGLRAAFNAMAATIWKNYQAKQKKMIFASDDIQHWLLPQVPNPQHFDSFVGAESTVLVIKDKTENLVNWLNPQEFRKFFSCLLFFLFFCSSVM
jgi:hypothetical protein